MLTRKLCAAAMLLTVASMGWAQQDAQEAPSVRLERNYPAGQYVMTQAMDMTQDIQAGGQTQQQKMQQTSVMTMVVDEPAADGTKKIHLRYKSIKQTMSMNGQTMRFDSDGPQEQQSPALAMGLRPMMKANIVLTLAADGSAKSVTGMDALWDELARSDPSMAPMARTMKQQMGDEMLRQMFDRTRKMLPERPVKVGDTWRSDLELVMPFVGEVAYTQESKLARLQETPEGQVATIDYVAKIASDRQAQAEMSGIPMTITSVEFDQKGQMLLNNRTGLVQQESLQQEGTMEMVVTGPDGQQVEMSIDQQLEMKTSLRKARPGEIESPAQTQPRTRPARGGRQRTEPEPNGATD